MARDDSSKYRGHLVAGDGRMARYDDAIPAAGGAGAVASSYEEAGSKGLWASKIIQGHPLSDILMGTSLHPELSLYQAVKQTRSSAYQDVVLVLGSTGSGKSTLVNYLLGHHFEESVTSSGDACLRVKEEIGLPAALMGDSVESCTLFPQSYLGIRSSGMGQRDLYYCDCPGFGDTRPLGNVVTSFSIDMVVRAANSVKGIILVVEHSQFYDTRANSLKGLVKTLMHVIKDYGAFKSVADSLLVVFNHKEAKPKTLVQVVAKLDSIIEAEKTKLKSLELRKSAGENGEDFLLAHRECLEMLCILGLLKQAVKRERFILVDFMDPARDRAHIMSIVPSFRGLAKEAIAFTSMDSDQQQFIQALIEIVGEANQSLVEFDRATNELHRLESRRIPELNTEVESLNQQLALLEKFGNDKLDLLGLRQGVGRSLVLQREFLKEKQSEHTILKPIVEDCVTRLKDLDNDTEIVCYRAEYNVTHIESAGRALAMTGAVVVTGLAAVGLLYGVANGLDLKLNEAVDLAEGGKDGLVKSGDYLLYKTLKYSGTPYNKVSYSSGIDGKLAHDRPSAGEFCYHLNVVTSRNGMHNITLTMPKKLYRANPAEITQLKKRLGTPTTSGLARDLAVLDEHIARTASVIAETERFLSESSSSVAAAKASLSVRTTKLIEQLHSLQNERALILGTELPRIRTTLGMLDDFLRGNAAFYELIQHVAQVLQLHRDEDGVVSSAMQYFYQSLARRGISILNDFPESLAGTRPTNRASRSSSIGAIREAGLAIFGGEIREAGLAEDPCSDPVGKVMPAL